MCLDAESIGIQKMEEPTRIELVIAVLQTDPLATWVRLRIMKTVKLYVTETTFDTEAEA